MKTKVSHTAKDGSDFVTGLRSYFAYRDLGIEESTNGGYKAHVIKAVPGEEVIPVWHTHTVTFQMFFVLKGWVEFEYEDIGKVRMEVGSSVYQPPGIKHRELRHSDDLEVLEIVSPADFGTDTVE